MTDKERKDFISDLNDVETILLALEGLRPEMADKDVIKAVTRAVWRIETYLVRSADKERRNKFMEAENAK